MQQRTERPRVRIGVRWWLSLAFAIVAAAAAAAAVLAFAAHAKGDFRSHAEALVAGKSFVAAQQLTASLAAGTSPQIAVADVARQQQLTLALFGSGTKPVAAAGRVLGRERDALRSVRQDRRYVASSDNGRHVVVGIPLGGPYRGLVAGSSGLSLPAELRIVQDSTVRVGAIAAAIGFLVGLILAQLIALRLRRLSIAANAITAGDFSRPVGGGLRDEFGALAGALERMRVELKESFGRLAAERDRLRQLLERLHEGVVTVDRDLNVQFANAEARRLLGASLAEGSPLPSVDGLGLDRRARRLLRADAPTAESVHLPDGRTVVVSGVAAREESEGAILVLADLTEELRRESAEREFVANAAHELRTPLTTIIGAVEVLEAGAKDDPDERDRFIAHIGRESARLARLAQTLLMLARAQTGAELPPTGDVDVCSLLERVRDAVQPRPGVPIEVECDEELVVATNEDLLEQAIRNLVENAVKHTEHGRVLLSATETGGAVRIEVADTGSGIDAAARPHIFDRFYRGAGRDGDGYGLGLAMVQQVVRVLDATIEVESERGAGSRFAISLAPVRELDAVLA